MSEQYKVLYSRPKEGTDVDKYEVVTRKGIVVEKGESARIITLAHRGIEYGGPLLLGDLKYANNIWELTTSDGTVFKLYPNPDDKDSWIAESPESQTGEPVIDEYNDKFRKNKNYYKDKVDDAFMLGRLQSIRNPKGKLLYEDEHISSFQFGLALDRNGNIIVEDIDTPNGTFICKKEDGEEFKGLENGVNTKFILNDETPLLRDIRKDYEEKLIKSLSEKSKPIEE